jgi:CRISPR-associated protein Csm4
MFERSYLIKLDLKSPLHIGEPGIGMERSLTYIPSDTLFSALCNMWATIYGKGSLENLIEQFYYEMPFCFSSAFPRLHIERDGQIKEICYLPHPLLHRLRRLPSVSADQEEAQKICDEAAKKGKEGTKTYVDLEFFQQLVSQKTLDMKYFQGMGWASKLLRLTHHKSLYPRVSLDRMTSQSNLFFCQAVRFGTSVFHERDGKWIVKGGLFCLLRAQEGMADKLRGCFELLGEERVGGERSVGYGRFKCSGWDEEQTLFPGVDKPEGFVTLSLYHPSVQEREKIKEDRERIGYQLVKRGGWIDSPFITGQQRKKSCFMFEEGSVFGFAPRGEVLDVTPMENPEIHRIYRCGLAFAVGVKL